MYGNCFTDAENTMLTMVKDLLDEMDLYFEDPDDPNFGDSVATFIKNTSSLRYLVGAQQGDIMHKKWNQLAKQEVALFKATRIKSEGWMSKKQKADQERSRKRDYSKSQTSQNSGSYNNSAKKPKSSNGAQNTAKKWVKG